MVKVAAIGVAAVLLAMPFKNGKAEYGILLTMAACLLLFTIAVSKLSNLVELVHRLEEYMNEGSIYITILLKMLGITFVAEFASDLCQDAGYAAVAGQIEFMGKLLVLGISMPILLSLLDAVTSLSSL